MLLTVILGYCISLSLSLRERCIEIKILSLNFEISMMLMLTAVPTNNT